MAKRTANGSASLIPPHATLPGLAKAAKNCRACDLWKNATQTVFGESGAASTEGGTGASMMLVGEQPGDQEDVQGKPFVGPAGS